MNNDNQLSKLEKEITSNFENKLKNNQIKVAHHEQEQSIFGLWTEVRTSLATNDTNIDFKRTISSIIKVDCGYSYEIDWKELVGFVKRIETLSNEQALASFQSTLNSTQNTYQNLIQTMQNQFQQQISHHEQKNIDLQAKITAFENEAQRLLEIQAKIHQNQQYLPSQERVSLENLRFKFELLSKQAKDSQAQQELLKQHCRDLENSLAIIEANLQTQQQNFSNADARWKAAEIKLSLTKVNETYLASVKAGLEQANERINQSYLTEAYNVTKLTDLLIRLNDLIEDEKSQHQKEIEELQSELTKTIGELTMNQEDLEKLTKINFLNKVKLSAILALDTSRSFLPNWYGQTLTSLETTILVGQATQSSLLENTTWTLLFFLVVSSLIHSFSRLCKFLYQKFNKKPNKIKNTQPIPASAIPESNLSLAH